MSNVFELRPSPAPDNYLAEPPPLQSGGGGGTYDGMTLVDAKIAAAEARTDAKFSTLEAKIDNIQLALGGLRTTIVLTSIAVVGVVVGAMAFGASQFGNGVMVTSAAVQDAAEAKRIAVENAAEVRLLREDINKLVGALQQLPAQQNAPER